MVRCVESFVRCVHSYRLLGIGVRERELFCIGGVVGAAAGF